MSSDLKQLKEKRKQFDKVSAELESAFVRNSESPKAKPQQCEEAERNLGAIKKLYGQSALNYASHLNMFYLTRSHSVLDMVQVFSQSVKSFYQYGNGQVEDHDCELADISTNLCRMNEIKNKSLEQMDTQFNNLKDLVIKKLILIFHLGLT